MQGSSAGPFGVCRPDEVGYQLGEDVYCYSLTPKLPFALALAACRNMSGRLATVHSQQHNALLYAMLTEPAFIGAVARRHVARHPLGDAGPGVIWSWLSGHAPSFTNVLYTETAGFYRQPDGGGFEGCMEMLKHPVLQEDPGNGFWGDTDCRASKRALCGRLARAERPVSSYPSREWRFEPRPDRRARCAAGFSRVGVRRSGELSSRSTCLSGRQPAGTFTEATQRCQQLDPTATVSRPARLAGRRRWQSPHSGTEVGLHWAGADRRNPHLQWQWQEDGGRVPPTAWAAGEPRGGLGADCAAFDPVRRALVAADCQARLEFLCESTPHGCAAGFHVSATGLQCIRDDQRGCHGSEQYLGQPNDRACTARLCPVGCPSGYTQLGLKCLQTNDTASWFAESSSGCQKQRMRVMKPVSQRENEFMRRHAQRTGRPLWLQYPDGGGFDRWHRYVSHGLPSEPNEPLPSEPNEPAAPARVSGSCAIAWFDGEWMDVDCLGEFPVVCERPISWNDCAGAGDTIDTE